LGPSLDALRAILEERKRRILNTYEVKSVQKKAKISYQEAARKLKVPKKQEKLFRKAVTQEQPYLLERLWYHVGDDQSDLANGLLRVLKCMSEKHQIEQLESDYEFLGRESLKIDEKQPKLD
jgi:hypothetical protein